MVSRVCCIRIGLFLPPKMLAGRLEAWIEQMEQDGVQANVVTYNSAINVSRLKIKVHR